MFLSNRGSFRPETSGAYTLRRRGRRRPKSGSAIGACAVARLAGSGGPIGDYYGSANSQRALGGAGGRGEGVGRLEAGQLGGVDAQGRARLFEDERRAGLGLGDADGDVRRPGGQHAQHGCHLAGPLREPDGHAVALAHAGGGEPPGDAQGAAGKLPVGRLAVGSPPQRRGIRLGLGAGEEPSVERPAAEVGPLRVRLGARRALRRGQQVGERLRPVVFAVEAHCCAICLKHLFGYFVIKQFGNVIPRQKQPVFMIVYLMIQQYLWCFC